MKQQAQWNVTFAERPDMFGPTSSGPARVAAALAVGAAIGVKGVPDSPLGTGVAGVATAASGLCFMIARDNKKKTGMEAAFTTAGSHISTLSSDTPSALSTPAA